MKNCPSLTFIIPTLNEEKNLPVVLESIAITMGLTDHQIIICDNGSTDNTKSIAQKYRATIFLEDSEATIGGLRNLGVTKSTGDFLVFLDADVSLDSNWWMVLQKELPTWSKADQFITGSTCLVPDNASFVERYWFSKLQFTSTNYINSGHMIIPRLTFNSIGGFDRALKTAEDYELCRRAKLHAIPVFKTPSLRAYHNGYPKTLIDFMTREAWHGKQDLASITSLLRSKTASLAFLNIIVLILGLFLSIYWLSFLPLFLSSVGSIGFCALATYIKFGRNVRSNLIPTIICCELYLIGRAGSLLTKGTRPKARSKNY